MACVTIRDPGNVSLQERFADHESKLSIMLWADHHQVDAPYLSYNLLADNQEAVLDVKKSVFISQLEAYISVILCLFY